MIGIATAHAMDISGTWQVNLVCNPDGLTRYSVRILQDPDSATVTLLEDDCGTARFDSQIREIASCSADPVEGTVQGATVTLPVGLYTRDLVLAVPSLSPSFGSCQYPVARIRYESGFQGVVAEEQSGRALKLTGSSELGTVRAYDVFQHECYANLFGVQCPTVWLRNGVKVGVDQTVEPLESASVTFSIVTTEGIASITPLLVPDGQVPANFVLLPGALYYDVATTAAYLSPITVCLPYADADGDGYVDGTTPPIPEETLQILHDEVGVFVDRTTSRDPVANQICGTVTSLSQFIIAALPPSACGDGTVDPGEQCDDGNTLNGDCCSSTCQWEAAGSPCGSDGFRCTVDACDGGGTCTHLPASAGTVCRRRSTSATRWKLATAWGPPACPTASSPPASSAARASGNATSPSSAPAIRRPVRPTLGCRTAPTAPTACSATARSAVPAAAARQMPRLASLRATRTAIGVWRAVRRVRRPVLPQRNRPWSLPTAMIATRAFGGSGRVDRPSVRATSAIRPRRLTMRCASMLAPRPRW